MNEKFWGFIPFVKVKMSKLFNGLKSLVKIKKYFSLFCGTRISQFSILSRKGKTFYWAINSGMFTQLLKSYDPIRIELTLEFAFALKWPSFVSWNHKIMTSIRELPPFEKPRGNYKQIILCSNFRVIFYGILGNRRFFHSIIVHFTSIKV